MKKIGIGILGATGYGAGELLRLLTQHKEAEVVSLVSSSSVGASVASVHPQLTGFYENKLEEDLDIEKLSLYEEAVVFSALPHGVGADKLAKLIAKLPKLKIVDLSADFRLKTLKEHEKHYAEVPFLEELRAQFVYGLPELYKEEILKAKYVANPGCLATAASLSVAPLISKNFSGQIVFDLKTGTSGAGRKIQESMHHPKRDANCEAYKILEHRHEAEVLQNLGDPQGKRISSQFVPHLLPTSRGILATTYLTLEKEVSTLELLKLYAEFYRNAPFVRIVESSPSLNAVIGSNFCDISLKARGKQVVCVAALDNLVKGMAGAAIQNMNLICGLEEISGIWQPALGPA